MTVGESESEFVSVTGRSFASKSLETPNGSESQRRLLSAQFTVHKDVLQRSNYFRDLMAKEINTEELTLEIVASCLDFELYLDWLYHGEIGAIYRGLLNVSEMDAALRRCGVVHFEDPVSTAMLDGCIVRTMCYLLLLANKLNDPAFGDYVLSFRSELVACLNKDAFRHFPLSLEEGIILWKSGMCNSIQDWIVGLILPGLKRTVLSANRARCPRELYTRLSKALPCSYKVYVGNAASQEVIRVDDGDQLPVVSTLFQQATKGSHDEEGAWIVPLEQHTLGCFLRYLRCVQFMGVRYEDIVDAPFEDHNGVQLPVDGDNHREQSMQNLCELWMLAEHVDDKLTRDACTRHLIGLWTNHGFRLSWDTLKFIGNEVPKNSKLRKWVVDTFPWQINTDAIALWTEIPAGLLSQLLVASAALLQKHKTLKDCNAMAPRLEDLNEYCDK